MAVLVTAGLVGASALATTSSSSGVRATAAYDPAVSSYPEPQRTADGRDLLDHAPKPQECPAVSTGRPDGYVPLSRLSQRKADDPHVKGEPASVVLRFVNDKGQRFRIFVSARTDGAIRRYIKDAAICLEWIRLREALPTVHASVLLDEPLVAAAVQLTGRTRNSLNSLQGSLPASATFADVIVAAGQEPAAVIDRAAPVVRSELAAKVAAGELSAAEVAALDVPGLLRALVDEPNAPFLFGSSEVPRSAVAEGVFLRADKRGSVLVSMQPLSRVPRRSWIWFGVDPPIGRGVIHGYRAYCTRYASVRIRATSGSAGVKFWREPRPDIGTRWATAASGYSAPMHHRSSGNRTYDVNVKGGQRQSAYNIQGGWNRGTGGAC